MAAAQTIAVGDVAPNFTLRDTEGQAFEFATVVKAHRVTVLNFWATWCGPCIRELPEFDAVYRQLKGQGLALLGVNAKEPLAKVLPFVRDLGLSFPMLPDPAGTVQAAYGAGPGLPVSLLIDGTGKVRQRLNGATTGGALLGRIKGLLAEPRL